MIRIEKRPKNRAFSGAISGGVYLGQRVATYCRVSTDGQSCGRQERDLRAFAKRAGHNIIVQPVSHIHFAVYRRRWTEPVVMYLAETELAVSRRMPRGQRDSLAF